MADRIQHPIIKHRWKNASKMKIILTLSLAVIALSACSNGNVIKPQVTCSPAACKLPDCFCSNIEIPGGFRASDIPQIVYLTFDDGITIGDQYDFYNELFNTGKVNPNQQNITGTFFTTHEYNDYVLTHERWTQGHEIALHSITHKSNVTYWETLDKAGWEEDVVAQKQTLAAFAKIPEADIQGFRAPFLQGGADTMYEVLRAGGLRYESSRPTRILRPVLWPYTADFDTIQDCQIQPCPTKSHPGFWVSPLVDFLGSNGQPCAMVDTCQLAPMTADETYDLLWKNFQDHYNSNRAPFGVYTHAAWILNNETPWIKTGYLRFVDAVLALGDAYIVSISKGLDWVQNPATLADLDALPDSWKPAPPKNNQCFFAFSCTFDNPLLPPELQPGTRYMRSCSACPPRYPWRGNPTGN